MFLLFLSELRVVIWLLRAIGHRFQLAQAGQACQADWPTRGSAPFLADNCGHQTSEVLEQCLREERLRLRIEDFFRPEFKVNSYQTQGANWTSTAQKYFSRSRPKKPIKMALGKVDWSEFISQHSEVAPDVTFLVRGECSKIGAHGGFRFPIFRGSGRFPSHFTHGIVVTSDYRLYLTNPTTLHLHHWLSHSDPYLSGDWPIKKLSSLRTLMDCMESWPRLSSPMRGALKMAGTPWPCQWGTRWWAGWTRTSSLLTWTCSRCSSDKRRTSKEWLFWTNHRHFKENLT